MLEDAGLVFRRGLLSAGFGIGQLGFTSRLPRVQAMTLAILEESQLLRLKNGL